ncbi:MAG: penicillin-binding protein 2, partial [Gammaproteobacteria bacterium]|nr:penicillin-binding protein 2 [Gammaproteobacteria bacterium]NIR95508.1 penicillin-binding protein 2 [Gammaproteobacteria bacterium]NIW50266.1 penicillin-binding protein 2 [Gammaproteobacteria bacterium]NIX01601.1 penicillin-binding protein 2 [Phycisphaerae bacterium]
STVNKYRARGGTLVMLDARTGEVMAMVGQPSYNPNNRNDLKSDFFRNRAVTDVFEPGSTI